MAFYGYHYGHTDDLYSTSYQYSEYNMVPTPFQASFPPSSCYEFDEPKVGEYDYFITPSVSNDVVHTEHELIHYSPVENLYSEKGYYSRYHVNPLEISYSVYHCTQPKLLQYDPSLSSETEFIISYSVSTQEFNAPEFKEYSPDPYRGGYDPITTYGHPLPPSDGICYPRSTPRSDISLDGYGKEGLDNLSTKLPITMKETDVGTDVLEKGGEATGTTGSHSETGVPVQSTPDDDSHRKHDDDESENGENEDYDDKTGTGSHGEAGAPIQSTTNDDSQHKHGDDGFENGGNENYDDKIGWQTSYGSGLETIDLCESIFGSWPCLEKIERQQRDNFLEICDQVSRRDPWKLAADYLFGSPAIDNYENYHHLQ